MHNHTHTGAFKVLGQVAGTFIAVERNNALYLIDQHAAHERIIFDTLQRNLGTAQILLIPYHIHPRSDEEARIMHRACTELSPAGFRFHEEPDGSWHVTAVPLHWRGSEEQLAHDILYSGKNAHDILRHVLATCACRSACKDGTILDDATLHSLVEQAFALPQSRCPHGRPIWIVIGRDELFKRIKRT
nr:hypothetical protein [Treponema pallidum]